MFETRAYKRQFTDSICPVPNFLFSLLQIGSFGTNIRNLRAENVSKAFCYKSNLLRVIKYIKMPNTLINSELSVVEILVKILFNLFLFLFCLVL